MSNRDELIEFLGTTGPFDDPDELAEVLADGILARWRLVPVNATDKQLAAALGMDTTQQVRRWSVTDERP